MNRRARWLVKFCVYYSMSKKCPICGSANVVNANGEAVCSACGYVFPEAFEDEKPVVTRFEWLGSAPVKTQGYGFAQSRVGGDEKRFIASYETKINRASDVLGFPRAVRDEAVFLAKKVRKTTMIRGYSHDVIAGALTLVAAKLHGAVAKPQQVAKAFGVNEKRMMKFYRKTRFALNVNVPIRKASEYIFAYAGRLGLSERVAREAVTISSKMPQGAAPIVLAGASLYVAANKSGFRLRQYEIAEVLGITDVALRRQAHILEAALQKQSSTVKVVN